MLAAPTDGFGSSIPAGGQEQDWQFRLEELRGVLLVLGPGPSEDGHVTV